MTALVIRMVLSLCIVLGLLLLAARIANKRYHSGSTTSSVRVLQRQVLSRGSTVTVVSVGTRVLVLGTTEQQVRVLAELRPDEIAVPEVVSAASAPTGPLGPTDAEPGRLYAVPGTPGSPVVPDFAQVLLEAQEPGPAPVAPSTTPGRHAARHRSGTAPVAPRADVPPTGTPGALAGSLLSPQTWRQALQAVSGRAS